MKRLLSLFLILLAPAAFAQPQSSLQVGTTTIQFGTPSYVLSVGGNGRLANVPATFPASSIAVGTPVTGASGSCVFVNNANTLGCTTSPNIGTATGTSLSVSGNITTGTGSDGIVLGAGGGNAFISAAGASTNIALNYRVKGNEWHLFKTATDQILAAVSNSGASTNRYPILSGGVSGSGTSAQILTNSGPLLIAPNSPRIQLGGVTSSFPQIFQSGAEVQFLLADQTSAGGTTAGTRARYFRSPATALSNCGTPNGVGNGTLCYASDLTATNIGAVATGGGALFAYVYSDGTNWRVLGANAAQGITLAGASSGSVLLQPNGAAAGTITVPNGTDVLVARNTVDTLTNKTISGGAISSTTTGTTQSPGTNNTTLATTAYADAAAAAGGVPVASTLPFAGVSAPTGYLFANGQAVSRTTYSALFAALTSSSTVTITIASPGVVTWNSHGLSAGAPVVFSTTGALPAGLTAGTTYYVRDEAANTFSVSATAGGAAINTSGSQSGTQTARYVPFGNGDGSTTFNVPDLRGRAGFGVDNMGGVAFASRLGSNSSVGGFSGLATLGVAGGDQTHVQTVAELAPHTHASAGGLVGGIDVGGTGAYLSAGLPNNGTSGSAGSGSPFNITPPALVLNYIIKHRRRPPARRNQRPTQRYRRAA